MMKPIAFALLVLGVAACSHEDRATTPSSSFESNSMGAQGTTTPGNENSGTNNGTSNGTTNPTPATTTPTTPSLSPPR